MDERQPGERQPGERRFWRPHPRCWPSIGRGRPSGRTTSLLRIAPPLAWSPVTDWTDKNREAKRPYIEHALLLADLILPLETSSLQIHGVSFIAAATLAASLPASTRLAENPWAFGARLSCRSQQHIIPIVPDAVFALEFGNPARRSYFFVEADRATMPITRSNLTPSSFHRKLIGYLAAHKARQHVERFGFPNLRVLTLTTSVDRQNSMLHAVRNITNGQGSNIFLFVDIASFNSAPRPSPRHGSPRIKQRNSPNHLAPEKFNFRCLKR